MKLRSKDEPEPPSPSAVSSGRRLTSSAEETNILTIEVVQLSTTMVAVLKKLPNLEEIFGFVACAVGQDRAEFGGFPAREAGLEVWQLGHAGPRSLVGSAQGAKDAEQLVDL